MASPHVAGAAAVYMANQDPSARPAQVKPFMLAPENSEAVKRGPHRRMRVQPRAHAADGHLLSTEADWERGWGYQAPPPTPFAPVRNNLHANARSERRQ